jgi:hypothetical protein
MGVVFTLLEMDDMTGGAEAGAQLPRSSGLAGPGLALATTRGAVADECDEY